MNSSGSDMASSSSKTAVFVPALTVIISALCIGAVMAVVSTLFVKGISAFSAVREQLLSEQIIPGEDNGQLASFTLSDFSVNCAFLGGALLILWGVQAIVRIKSWQGPADIIFASHDAHARIEAKQGIFSAFASFVSLSAGASLGQYGPIVHLGGLVGHLAKRLRLVSHLGGDVWLGCGVAAAISAAFHAPVAGILFAHEAVLRHFSAQAAAPISLAAISATAVSFWLTGDSRLLPVSLNTPDILMHLPILLAGGVIFAMVAVIIMKAHFVVLAAQSRFRPVVRGIFAVAVLAALGSLVPDVLGLGLGTLRNLVNEDHLLVIILILFVAKFAAVMLSSFAGFSGGYFSPALFLGAAAGGIMAQIAAFMGLGMAGPLLVISGMAAVSGCVIGAPVAVVVMVMELTMSYDYAVGAMICVVTASFLTHIGYGHSLFDKQLQIRGINLAEGRVALSLSSQCLDQIMHQDYARAHSRCSVAEAKQILAETHKSELYLVDEQGGLVGKLSGMRLGQDETTSAAQFAEDNILVFSTEMNLLQAIEKATGFVGESIPVIHKQTGKLTGVVSEADLFAAFLSVQKTVTRIEHG